MYSVSTGEQTEKLSLTNSQELPVQERGSQLHDGAAGGRAEGRQRTRSWRRASEGDSAVALKEAIKDSADGPLPATFTELISSTVITFLRDICPNSSSHSASLNVSSPHPPPFSRKV